MHVLKLLADGLLQLILDFDVDLLACCTLDDIVVGYLLLFKTTFVIKLCAVHICDLNKQLPAQSDDTSDPWRGLCSPQPPLQVLQ
jgi:hypothetical protein